MRGSAICLSATDASLPRRCEFDEHALGPDASLFVGVDDLVGPRDRCCDVEGQLAVHLSRHMSQQLDSNGDCETVGGCGSDACGDAALPSSSYQRFVDNIPVLRSVDSFQDDRGFANSMNNTVQTPIDFPEVSPAKSTSREVPSFGEGRARDSNMSTVPAAWRRARLRTARGLAHLAARVHERACQRRGMAEGHRNERRPQDLVWP